MVSANFDHFCEDWLRKANLCNETSIDGCYDKFFTLFVVFNRLYAESTFELARRGLIRIQPNRPLPDRRGATEYTLQLIGSVAFAELHRIYLFTPVSIIATLIESGQFSIKLSNPNGDSQPDKDRKLLLALRSSGNTRDLAILDLIYSIRCNLFHGHKEFQQVQSELLRPAIEILNHVIQSLRHELGRRGA